MKLIAHYDTAGTIQALIRVDAPEGFNVTLAPEAGMFVGEVETGGLTLTATDASTDALEDLLKNYKIATPPTRLTLTTKAK